MHDAHRSARALPRRARAAALAMLAAAGAAAAAPDIDALVDRMTVEEKAGQMTQLNISVIIDGEETPGSPFTINDEKLRRIVVDNNVGSLFGVWHGALSLERWRDMVERIQKLAIDQTRLGVPVVFADDSVHGANYLLEGTLFPHNLNLAATWDPAIAEAVGHVTAVETRAKGTHWTFAPVADLARQPMWSRVFETFGEDPMLAGAMASSVVRGLQGDSLDSDFAVAATAKHFLGYPVPMSGRDRTPVHLGPAEFYGTHLAPFEAVFDAGAATVMINSGEINGVPVHVDDRILIDLLRDRIGFEGVAVTDWGDIDKLVGVHRVAADKMEATRMAIEAGVDMSMVAQSTDFTDNVIALVGQGRLSESTLDRSVRRILELKKQLGLWESPVGGEDAIPLVGSDEHHQLSADAARQSLVLLRNRRSVLPLGEDARILVTGPTSDDIVPLHGAWSYTWQGLERAFYPDVPTVADALRARFGEEHVTHLPGSSYTEDAGIAEAARAAEDADVVVLCLGEQPSAERPGDLDNFNLDPAQLELARALIDSGKPVVAVLVTNRPRPFAEVEDGLEAIVWAGHPGPHGGEAIAELLAGDFNPSGRLPFTYPRHPASLATYDRKNSENIQKSFAPGLHNPLFEFGDGMGYSPFAYFDLEVTPSGRSLEVSVTVENTGSRAGEEVVQVYVTDLVASVTPHTKRLKAFRKVEIQPGRSQTLSFTINEADLTMVDRDGKRVFEPGAFRVSVGGEVADVTLD